MKNAGTYYVRVYRPEDDSYLEFKRVYSYTINPATPSVNWPEASNVLAGQKLSTSELQGGDAGLVAGSFAWSKPDLVLDKTTSCEVKFIPLDPNYKETTGNISVEVISMENSDPTTPPEENKVIEDGNNETISGTYQTVDFNGNGTNILSNVTATTLTVFYGGERTFTLDGTIDIKELINYGTITLQGNPTIHNFNITNNGIFKDETGTITIVKGEASLSVSLNQIKEGNETISLKVSVIAPVEPEFQWQHKSGDEWEPVSSQNKTTTKGAENSDKEFVRELKVNAENAGEYRCFINCKNGNFETTLVTYTTVTIDDPDTPEESSEYYNISTDEVCDGVEISFSAESVTEGQSVNVYVKKDEEHYTFENFKLYIKRGNTNNWEELKESDQQGEYTIQDIRTDIYVKAEGSQEKTPTNIEDVEGVKIYTNNGSLFIQTPQREQVIIISIAGTVVKNSEQIGLKQYQGLNSGIYIVRIGKQVFKIRI